MKKYLFMALAATALITFSQSCKKKVKDEDITKAATEALATAKSPATVTVKDGVVSLAGNCPDTACVAAAKAALKDVKGIKGDIVNSITVAPPPPPPASMTTTLDAATMQKVKDGMKDIKGVDVTFAGDKVVLAGSITDADRMKVMQMLGAAKLKSDVTKLMKK